jgi:hypothetical protein
MTDISKKLDAISFIISGALISISIVIGITYYNVNDRKLMSSNIDSAIAKGIDPISVRCSFAQSGDTICVAHAASMGSGSTVRK